MDNIDPDDSMESTTPVMSCARIAGCGKLLEVIDSCAQPSTPDDGVLLRTLYTGVCHSDVHFIDGNQGPDGTVKNSNQEALGDDFEGVILGHEICGEVVEVGKGVSHACALKTGDVVIVYPWKGCRECETCSGGASNLCENNPSGTRDIGQSQFGGGYASMVAVPEADLCIKLPSSIPPEIGCMLPCSALSAYGAIKKARPYLDNAVRTRGMANMLVIGIGGLGMWAVVLMKSVFCDKSIKVICADTSREKLDLAAELGADDVVHWDSNQPIETLVDATTVSGYNLLDAAIDFVGKETTCRIAMNSLHQGGCLVVMGLYGGQVNISIPEITVKSIAIIGNRVAPIAILKELVDLLAVQKLDKYIHTEFKELPEINETLDHLRNGSGKGRYILKF